MESPTRSLEIKGSKGVHLESRGGGIGAVAFNDISFKSEVGALRLDTASILMPALPTAKPTSPGHLKYSNPQPAGSGSAQSAPDIYQLCVCESGKLFLASPHLVCASENDDRVCR
ncbi:unnamed protein product [Acanthoscelides obtectus]|uniref:Uncharacterized protein n=1 Tax=Acanthoscelides obtectus TaxID=200917 RepID=A0A9P0MIL4_ACAOB|nr:unnamed protein product [Acanthoscelides obtectus]